MDFILSKILWLAVNPGNLLLIVLTLSLPLLYRRKGAVLGRRLVVGVTLFLLIFAILPVGRWLIVPLEARFPAKPAPERVDGIIVLGGFVDTVLSQKTGRVEVGGAVERLFAMIELANRHPKAKIIFSGGSGSVLYPEAREAPLVKQLLQEIGFDANRAIFEDRSRNTHENAVFSKELGQPVAGETWLLVTSAAHMPRAVGCFRRQDWNVSAWPVDYVTDRELHLDLGFNLAGKLGLFGAAIHEWLGLISYAAMDRTSQVFPAP